MSYKSHKSCKYKVSSLKSREVKGNASLCHPGSVSPLISERTFCLTLVFNYPIYTSYCSSIASAEHMTISLFLLCSLTVIKVESELINIFISVALLL